MFRHNVVTLVKHVLSQLHGVLSKLLCLLFAHFGHCLSSITAITGGKLAAQLVHRVSLHLALFSGQSLGESVVLALSGIVVSGFWLRLVGGTIFSFGSVLLLLLALFVLRVCRLGGLVTHEVGNSYYIVALLIGGLNKVFFDNGIIYARFFFVHGFLLKVPCVSAHALYGRRHQIKQQNTASRQAAHATLP